ncbi:hypothetical protein AYK21_01540 [Thermoplasmatales archaeon SG8-52-2]|nr:MAG: hypothetical protein AYK21_01540 [Thermoplasmatales archaeon SG8-52-2]
MPGKKLTARKRAELKQKKLKEMKRSNSSVLIIFFIIIIVGIAGGYYVITSLDDGNGQVINGQSKNKAPIAIEDYFIVPKNAYQFRIEALNNDYDLDDDELNITSITLPENGEAEIMDNKTIRYVPAENFTGSEKFTYTISDGKKETTADINVIVPDNPENSVALFDTSKGTFAVELYNDKMPITCDNFINIANTEFYDGMIFHRISDNFMIQAGNTFPDGTTKESPFENIIFEVSDVKHLDGTISMASTGAGVGGSSQFFICDGPQSFLDGNYAAFGKTIFGMNVVRDIADDEHDNSNPAGGGKPLKDIIINSITIHSIF